MQSWREVWPKTRGPPATVDNYLLWHENSIMRRVILRGVSLNFGAKLFQTIIISKTGLYPYAHWAKIYGIFQKYNSNGSIAWLLVEIKHTGLCMSIWIQGSSEMVANGVPEASPFNFWTKFRMSGTMCSNGAIWTELGFRGRRFFIGSGHAITKVKESKYSTVCAVWIPISNQSYHCV